MIIFFALLLSLPASSYATHTTHAEGNPLYDITKSFQENCTHGPFFSKSIPSFLVPNKSEWKSILGYAVSCPIGIPACALMTSKGIALTSKLGFNILTYKTIRSCAHLCLNYPNICYVDCDHQISSAEVGSTFYASHKSGNEFLAISNSFGISAFEPYAIQKDIALARASLSEGQILIVSVLGSPITSTPIEEDFAATAKMAYEAGAHIIEANLSCPNVDGGLLYKDSELVFSIVNRISHEVPIPIIIKVGIFDSPAQMRATLAAAARAGARGICGINSVPVKIITANNKPFFGPDRIMSGLSGDPIRSLALQFIHDAQTIIDEENLDLIIFATGGITKPEHFQDFFDAGAMVAMTATGMMWNPYLAIEYHYAQQKETLLKKIVRIGAFKFGNFTLKNGTQSSIYIDLRSIISYPDILQSVAECLWPLIETTVRVDGGLKGRMETSPLASLYRGERGRFDHICGVPYTALPIATALSLTHHIPMIIKRKEAKNYGTKKMVEGNYKPGDTCLLIEDVITTGSSILETIASLEQEGLKITDIVVCVDREEGGVEYVHSKGYHVHVLYTLSEIINLLHDGDYRASISNS